MFLLPEDYTLVDTKVEAKTEAEVSKVAAKKEAGKSTVYKQTTEPSSLLFRILSEYPGIKQGIADEIMSWEAYKGVLHPAEVQHLLNQMANVPFTLTIYIWQNSETITHKFCHTSACLRLTVERKDVLCSWH